MPLYMDIHVVDADTLSVEDVVKAHMEDLAIQDKFGVTQLKYWVNEDAKTLFCLMEGPDKDACNNVHLESHGNTACNIIEVSDNEYNLFMGQGTAVNDLAQTTEGELDTGYRTLLRVEVVDLDKLGNRHLDYIHALIQEEKGSLVIEPSAEILASFTKASEALSCAQQIHSYLQGEASCEYGSAIASGRPVDETGDGFFRETKQRVESFCALGFTKRCFIDPSSGLLIDKEKNGNRLEFPSAVYLTNEQANLAEALHDILNRELLNTSFSSKDLIHELGWSKSQTYRKTMDLSSFSPNKLIQEVKLKNALEQLTNGDSTVAEVAYASGFNTPTYFTRVFKQRFGSAPSSFR